MKQESTGIKGKEAIKLKTKRRLNTNQIFLLSLSLFITFILVNFLSAV